MIRNFIPKQGLFFVLASTLLCPMGLSAQEPAQVELEVQTPSPASPHGEEPLGSAIETSLTPEGEVPTVSGVKLDLKDCVQMALLNNKEIKATAYDVVAAQYKLKEAQPKSVPTIEYEFLTAPAPRDVDNAVNSFFTGNVTFFQRGKLAVGSPLYTFGKIGLAQGLAKQGILAEKQKRVEKKNDVILKVKQLYYGILLAKDLRELFEDAERHLSSEITRRESADEPSDPVNLVKLKLYRFEVLSRLAELDKKDRLARHALRIQVGLPRATEVDIAEDHLRPVDFELQDFDHYLNLSQKYRPKKQLLEIGLKAKELQYRLQKRDIAPNVGIGGIFEFGVTAQDIQGLQLTDDFNDPFNFTRAGLGIRIEGTLNPKRYVDKLKQMQADYFKVAMQKSVADEGLELEIREAYLDVEQSEKNMKNSREAMKTARQYVFLTKTNIDIGIGDKKEHSESLQAYLVARGRFFESILNYNLSVAALEQRVGGVARN